MHGIGSQTIQMVLINYLINSIYVDKTVCFILLTSFYFETEFHKFDQCFIENLWP